MYLYSILDSKSETSTFFVAESDDVAKRNFLLAACQTPFWKDFVLRYTGVSCHDDGFACPMTVFDADGVEEGLDSYVIDVSQDEIDSFMESIERAKLVRARAYESVKSRKVNGEN